jgi:hypothetical protein
MFEEQIFDRGMASSLRGEGRGLIGIESLLSTACSVPAFLIASSDRPAASPNYVVDAEVD